MTDTMVLRGEEWECFTTCEPNLHDIGLLDWTTEKRSSPESEINGEIMSGAASRFGSMDELIESLNDGDQDD